MPRADFGRVRGNSSPRREKISSTLEAIHKLPSPKGDPIERAFLWQKLPPDEMLRKLGRESDGFNPRAFHGPIKAEVDSPKTGKNKTPIYTCYKVPGRGIEELII